MATRINNPSRYLMAGLCAVLGALSGCADKADPVGTAHASEPVRIAARHEPEPTTVLPVIDRPGVPADSSQAVVVVTENWRSFSGKLARYARASEREPWHRVDEPVSVAIGRYGLAWGLGLHPLDQPGLRKMEGDHRSPAGIFDLGEARGYAPEPPEGTSWPYQPSGTDFRCIDNKRSAAYNTFVPTQGLFFEPLDAGVGARRDVVFEHMIFVLHNMAPVYRGAGSCLFLHVWSDPGVPTQGCVAMARDDLRTILAWLQLERRPVLVQLPRPVLEQLTDAWGIPSDSR